MVAKTEDGLAFYLDINDFHRMEELIGKKYELILTHHENGIIIKAINHGLAGDVYYSASKMAPNEMPSWIHKDAWPASKLSSLVQTNNYMPEPMFSLDEMELAESIINGRET